METEEDERDEWRADNLPTEEVKPVVSPEPIRKTTVKTSKNVKSSLQKSIQDPNFAGRYPGSDIGTLKYDEPEIQQNDDDMLLYEDLDALDLATNGQQSEEKVVNLILQPGASQKYKPKNTPQN